MCMHCREGWAGTGRRCSECKVQTSLLITEIAWSWTSLNLIFYLVRLIMVKFHELFADKIIFLLHFKFHSRDCWTFSRQKLDFQSYPVKSLSQNVVKMSTNLNQLTDILMCFWQASKSKLEVEIELNFNNCSIKNLQILNSFQNYRGFGNFLAKFLSIRWLSLSQNWWSIVFLNFDKLWLKSFVQKFSKFRSQITVSVF